MRLLAPAKINLHLRVGPRRQDGFHPLLSWFVTIGLFDTLTLETEEGNEAQGEALRSIRAGNRRAGNTAGAAFGIALDCDLPGLPCDERNLVVKIARAWRDAVRSESGAAQGDELATARHSGPRHVGGIRATLQKRIPIGAGL